MVAFETHYHMQQLKSSRFAKQLEMIILCKHSCVPAFWGTQSFCHNTLYFDRPFLFLQGLHDLISSGEVHDVLSNNNLDEKIMAEGWGGVTLFQIQNQVARGVGKLQAGAKV